MPTLRALALALLAGCACAIDYEEATKQLRDKTAFYKQWNELHPLDVLDASSPRGRRLWNHVQRELREGRVRVSEDEEKVYFTTPASHAITSPYLPDAAALVLDHTFAALGRIGEAVYGLLSEDQQYTYDEVATWLVVNNAPMATLSLLVVYAACKLARWIVWRLVGERVAAPAGRAPRPGAGDAAARAGGATGRAGSQPGPTTRSRKTKYA